MESQPESKQNLPPCPETAKAKSKPQKMLGIPAIRRGCFLHRDSQWRNRAEFFNGREAIKAFEAEVGD